MTTRLGAASVGTGLLLCVLSLGCSGGTTGKAEAPGATTPQSGGQADKTPPASKAASLTRDDFRAKVKTFKVYNSPDPKSRWSGRNIDDLSAMGWMFARSDFEQAFGKPTKTQTIGRNTFWYWTCQDGTVQVILSSGWADSDDRVTLVAINDY